MPWLVASAYAMASAAWIFFSDRVLLSLVPDLGLYQQIQTYKGWAFVALSSLLIFLLMRGAWRRLLDAYDAIEESERRLNLALTSAGAGIWEMDLEHGNRMVQHHSAELTERLGLEPDTPVPLDELRDREHPDDGDQAYRLFEDTIASGGRKPFSHRGRFRARDGRYVWLQTNGNIIRSADGRPNRMLGVIVDVTEQVSAEEALERALRFDGATGLLNQEHFLSDTNVLMSAEPAGQETAVVQFRLVDTDSRILDAENQLESQINKVVSDRMRAIPGLVGGRLGTDIFAFAIGTGDRDLAINETVSKCVRAILRPVQNGEQRVPLRAQIGAAIGTWPSDTSLNLIKNSTHALEMAPRGSKAEIKWFNRELREEFGRRGAMIRDLTSAVGNGEIECHYQPIVDSQSGKIWGFEALARWRRPGDSLVLPGEFIPLAEENGIIDEIGEAALRMACATAKSWPRPHPIVCVNVSPLQLDDASFPAIVAGILEETGLPPHRLELELTETALSKNPDRVAERLESLRDIGVRIAIDDFGTGYSSLSLLSRIPFSRLKIDRLFVSSKEQSLQQEAICDMIVSLAQSLDLALTAEGVETQEQAMKLAAKGVDCLQGFHFSRPVQAAEIGALIRKDWSGLITGDQRQKKRAETRRKTG